MPPAGRALLSKIVVRFVLLNSCFIVSSSEYNSPIEIQLWDTGRTPLAHMVDVTNEFGLKVLAEHNFLNDNNIAFSPYGLTGIMVALYEGVEGESSYQIQHGMQLPWTRNVMRVGFRDIHRTLKTYFVPEEGFLAGLALNNENVTFTDSYKKVLRFYGFDLDKEQLPTLPPVNSTSAATPTDGIGSSMTTVVTEASELDTTSTKPTEDRAESTTTLTTITTNSEQTPTPLGSTSNTDSDSAATMASTMGSLQEQETTIQNKMGDTTIAQNMPDQPVTDAEPPTQTSTTTSTEAAVPEEPTLNNEVESITTSMDPNEMNDPTMPIVETTTAAPSETMDTTNTEPTTIETSTLPSSMSTSETLKRRKKSIVDFIYTNPPYVDDYLLYKSYENPAPTPATSQDFSNEKMFMVNGLQGIEVTYMKYDTMLEHAFLPHLDASALRLPLDSDRYYLLVVLPARGGGSAALGRLLARMARESDLRDVHLALRPRRVRALVPSFTVKGHITLTTDLQKLGIREVFEPRQRDFGPMTAQAQVYVRSIEQAVSVAIRKYQPDERLSYRYVSSQVPVYFSATYPFLYFVMDSNIHVSLMAGKMVDPLNSRIL